MDKKRLPTPPERQEARGKDLRRILSGVASVEEILPYLLDDCFLPRAAAKAFSSLSDSILDMEVPRYRCGRRTLWRKSELERYIVEHEVTHEREWLAELMDKAIREARQASGETTRPGVSSRALRSPRRSAS